MTLIRMDPNKARQGEYKDDIPIFMHYKGNNHTCCSAASRGKVAWAKEFEDENGPYEEIVIREGCDGWLVAMSGLASPLPGGLVGNLWQLPYRFRVPPYPSARVWPGTLARPFFLPALGLNRVWDYTVGVFTPAQLALWQAGSYVYNLFFSSERCQYTHG